MNSCSTVLRASCNLVRSAVICIHMIMADDKNPQSSTESARVLNLARARLVIRARDVAAEGIHTGTLTRMVRVGALEKIGAGRYRLATSDVSESHSLVLACNIVPSSVVC